ncbi:MAG: Lrp/AsnC family transcriptional regulator [Desulfofustis sp.]
MDETNLKILRILQEKARIPNIEVSRLINLAPAAVLERIRKMEKQGIIDGYEVRLNPEQFGYAQIVFMHIHMLPGSDQNQAAELLSSRKEIQEVHYISGEDCFLVKLRTRNSAELNKLLQELLQSIDGVRTTRTFTVLSTKKETAQIPLD